LAKKDLPASMPQPAMSKQEIALHVQRSRSERYLRTARFVQSKWFMIGGTVAIVVFLIIMLLVAG